MFGGWVVQDVGWKKIFDDGVEYEVLDADVENAEVVRERILKVRDWVGVGIAGVGFVIAVIGGYGDGFIE
jgi:hypothetical protein